MAKNKTQKVYTDTDLLAMYMETEYDTVKNMPAPTYSFNIGDTVKIGNLVNPVVTYVTYDAKLYIVESGENDRKKNVYEWYRLRPIATSTESYVQNKDVRISYSNTDVNDLLTKVLHFGVDFDPEYQRGLVWSQEDRTALIDSIFMNVDIGKFSFIHMGYESEKAYQILDGKQRLTTIVDFYLNGFAWRGKYFNDLSYADRRWFTSFPIVCGMTKETDRKTVLQYFLMLNTTGHVVSEQHLAKVRKLLDSI